MEGQAGSSAGGKKDAAEQQAKENMLPEEQEEADREKMLELMMKILIEESGENWEPISYFDFVIDPDSFSRTIYNMYNVSFLVSKGLVSVFQDEDDFPLIVPRRPNVPESQLRQKGVIIGITMDDWKHLIDELEITEAMIKENTE